MKSPASEPGSEHAQVKFRIPYTRKRFPAFLYCLLFSRESRTTSSLLETIQKRRKTFPCVYGPKTDH